jgi:hypothetical protein
MQIAERCLCVKLLYLLENSFLQVMLCPGVFYLIEIVRNIIQSLPVLLLIGYRCPCGRLEREANHSPPSSIDVVNAVFLTPSKP